ncbi:chaperone BCS1 [Fusarium oxysporum f. sp. albedinis]|nr:chaperone BCS1 [Fusarium oxysporum f. sp. albedinis]
MLPFRYRASYQPSDQIQASRHFNEKELASEESNYYVVHIHSSGLLALKATERWWNQYSSSEACKGLNRVHCGSYLICRKKKKQSLWLPYHSTR